MVTSSKCKFLLGPAVTVLRICNAVGLHINKMNQCFNKRSYQAPITDSEQCHLL